MPPWYLLFDGQSADGRGDAHYRGRTEDPKVAYDHMLKCMDNPYSTGYVLFVNDITCRRGGSWLIEYVRQADNGTAAHE